MLAWEDDAAASDNDNSTSSFGRSNLNVLSCRSDSQASALEVLGPAKQLYASSPVHTSSKRVSQMPRSAVFLDQLKLRQGTPPGNKTLDVLHDLIEDLSDSELKRTSAAEVDNGLGR